MACDRRQQERVSAITHLCAYALPVAVIVQNQSRLSDGSAQGQYDLPRIMRGGTTPCSGRCPAVLSLTMFTQGSVRLIEMRLPLLAFVVPRGNGGYVQRAMQGVLAGFHSLH